MFNSARVCKCVHAHAGRVTDVVQRRVKDGELFGEDVLVHAEGSGVGATDVEVLLAKNHLDLRLERAWGEKGEKNTVETKAHLSGSLARREETLIEPWLQPEAVDYKVTPTPCLDDIALINEHKNFFSSPSDLINKHSKESHLQTR